MKQTNVSNHYLGTKGEVYFKSGFGTENQFGRLYQSQFFRPYCNESKVLLDFGCADGLFLRNLPALRRIGVEANPVAREKCRKLSDIEQCPIELHASLEEVKSLSADVVISNHCLEHVLNPYESILEIKRILKKGGIFVVMIPFDDWRKSGYFEWSPHDIDNHLYTWSPKNIGNLITEAGLKVEFSRICKRAWSPKLFWIYHRLGQRFFELSCFILSFMKQRREVFSVARKETS